MNTVFNKEIINTIISYLDDNPKSRFIEALYHLGIIPMKVSVQDFYFEESTDTLKRMDKVKQKGHI